MSESDKVFAGSIPAIYERDLVPLIFAPYALDLVARLQQHQPRRILEIAAGTGVVTRAMASAFGPEVAITATDLNQAMLDQAKAVGTARPVHWQQADAQQLPFADASFDAIVCQFGVMFFPDKPAAFAEMRRVLAPGGALLFNVWDSLEHNEIANIVTVTLAAMFPQDPPRFMARVPYGYFDHGRIAADLAAGGFAQAPAIETVTHPSRADSARLPAVATCQGTPLRSEIEARDASKLEAATDAVEAALRQHFGNGAIEAKIQALVVSVPR